MMSEKKLPRLVLVCHEHSKMLEPRILLTEPDTEGMVAFTPPLEASGVTYTTTESTSIFEYNEALMLEVNSGACKALDLRQVAALHVVIDGEPVGDEVQQLMNKIPPDAAKH